MRERNGFIPLEIGVPNQESRGLPKRHGETDVRKRHRSFLTGSFRGNFSRGAGFTLIELLTVVAIIVLLISILIPTLQTVKRQANSVACRSNLRQWGFYLSMYTQDNKDRFFTVPPDDLGWQLWSRALQSYYSDSNDLCFCPMATVLVNPTGSPDAPIRGGKSLAWGRLPGENRDLYGSYGLNSWICDNRCVSPTCWHQQCWKTIFVQGAGNIPMLLDCLLPGGRPDSQDGPPEFEDLHAGITGNCWMSHYCINRHEGTVNGIFMDWSARKIGLKELWTFKWHRSYNTANRWTTTGGVSLEDWPKWMRKYKDY